MRHAKKLLLIPLLGIALAGAVSRHANAETSLIELFTSQGCSSCPPADRLFQKLAVRKDLVALSFNVDYWDYLGWKDTLAKRAFSDRQRSYAGQRGDGAVYTPQIVINGLVHTIGSMPKQINKAIVATQNKLKSRHIPLNILVADGTFAITVGEVAQPPRKTATIWLASVAPEVTVKIKHGENRGKSLTYYNVVRQLSAVGMWAGTKTTIKLRERNFVRKKGMRCAVFVQTDGGAILAADWIRMPSQSN